MAAPDIAALTCTLAGHASVRIAAEEMAASRRAPGPPCGSPVPVPLLKHADEQSVACLAAVLRAIADYRLAPDGTPAPFRHWGIVGAPSFFSRDFIARLIPDYIIEGPLAVSPQTIPNRTMHSPAGTLSVALGIRGPNYGAGGGPSSEIEGLLSATSLLAERRLPGVWLLLSRIDPISTGGMAKGPIPPGTFAEAIAMALVPVGAPGPTLALVPDSRIQGQALTLDCMRNLLERIGQPGEASCPLPGFGRLEMRAGSCALLPTRLAA